MGHYRVRHPREVLHKPAAGVKRVNDWAAFKLAGLYGAALTIWLFAVYSTLGAVFTGQQVTLLYWSNSAQLVFCPLMVYVGNQLDKNSRAKADVDHETFTHIATVVDEINARVKANQPAP